MAEVRFHGELTQPQDLISAISMSSPSSGAAGLIEYGDTVMLDIQTAEPVYGMQVKVQGVLASVASSDNLVWTA